MSETVSPSERDRKNRCALSVPGDADHTVEIRRVTWTGMAVNLVLAVAKSLFGYLSGSSALLADAVHTVSDLATDAIILVGVRFWSAPADAEHPHGHRKIETVATLAIGLGLAVVGIGMGYAAVVSLHSALLRSPEAVHPSGPGSVTWLALSSALLSILSKEILYRWTATKGLQLESAALIANAWHHRSDALSSIPPAFSLAAALMGARLGEDLWFLDPLATLVICVMLLQAAWDIVQPTLASLLDASADRKLCSAIRKTVLATPGVADAHKIRTRCLGPNAVAVDLHIMVDGQLTVTAGHDIATDVKYRVMRLGGPPNSLRPVDVIVHVEPLAEEEPVFPCRRESNTMVDWLAKR